MTLVMARSALGQMGWLSLNCRTDLAFVLSMLSIGMNGARLDFASAAKWAVRYLAGATSLGLWYPTAARAENAETPTFRVFSDASWGPYPSTSSLWVCAWGRPVLYYAARQRGNSASTPEAEAVALS